MPILTAEKLIIAFQQLNDFLRQPDEDFFRLISSAKNSNAWFQPEEVSRALASISEMLDQQQLLQWFKQIKVTERPKNVGMILAGNIPMVGFHDILCVLATGNRAMIKLSSTDNKLLPALLDRLIVIEPALREQIVYVDRLREFDAIIATGSNNSSRYFDFYFGKVPHIIRKNRNSVAVLDGNESPDQIAQLGHDIFDYYGLGCRNVSKVYLPAGYDIARFFEPLEPFQPVINHFKYNNNYDYNKSIYLVNGEVHFDNGFLLLKEDHALTSPLAVLYFEYYTDLKELNAHLTAISEQLQCVVSHASLQLENDTVSFGGSQHPALWDYADNVDTIAFLNGL